MEQLASAVSRMPALTLDQLDELWTATARHDAKFLLSQAELLELIVALGDGTAVLEIGQRRAFSYRTEYFDTADRAMYLHHVQKKLRRVKIRERIYMDSGLAQLEIKAREGTSQTHKHVFLRSQGLDECSRKFVSEFMHSKQNGSHAADAAEVLHEEVAHEEVAHEDGGSNDLVPSAVTHFTRMTLFVPSSTEKITIDLNLTLEVGGQSVKANPDIALVEVKSLNHASHTVTQLRRLGFHPTQFSKYCSAIDLLASPRPRVHTRRTLERIFAATSHELTN